MCVHIPVTVHQPLNKGRPLFDRSAQIHPRNVPSPMQAQFTPGFLHLLHDEFSRVRPDDHVIPEPIEFLHRPLAVRRRAAHPAATVRIAGAEQEAQGPRVDRHAGD